MTALNPGSTPAGSLPELYLLSGTCRCAGNAEHWVHRTVDSVNTIIKTEDRRFSRDVRGPNQEDVVRKKCRSNLDTLRASQHSCAPKPQAGSRAFGQDVAHCPSALPGLRFAGPLWVRARLVQRYHTNGPSVWWFQPSLLRAWLAGHWAAMCHGASLQSCRFNTQQFQRWNK